MLTENIKLSKKTWVLHFSGSLQNFHNQQILVKIIRVRHFIFEAFVTIREENHENQSGGYYQLYEYSVYQVLQSQGFPYQLLVCLYFSALSSGGPIANFGIKPKVQSYQMLDKFLKRLFIKRQTIILGSFPFFGQSWFIIKDTFQVGTNLAQT